MVVEIFIWLTAGLLVLAGLAGLMVPVLPGAPVLFAGLVVAGWSDDFTKVGIGTYSVLGIMALLIYTVDVAAGAFGARRFGASPRAIAGAVLGTAAGLFFGIPGIILGPFVGAVLGELSVRPNLRAAGLAGVGATLGLALGVAAKMALAFAMLGFFAVMRFF